MVNLNVKIGVLCLFLLIFAPCVMCKNNSAEVKKNAQRGVPSQTIYSSGNWINWVYADGKSNTTPEGNSGGMYPRSNLGTIFQDGLIWGGILDGVIDKPIRIGGQTYNIGTVPGRILSSGLPENPDAQNVRVYKIRPNYTQMLNSDLVKEAAILLGKNESDVTNEDVQALRSQYQADYENWPVDMGAPYVDVNGNGIYDPEEGDTPGIKNAAITIWYVINDLDESTTLNLYGSKPIGLEVQITIWGYEDGAAKTNTVYKRCRLINKSSYSIDSMYIAQWSDPDIGDFSDDLVGCDPSLDLAYSYNGRDFDAEFNELGMPPASVGYTLLQGPMVYTGNYSDTGIFDFKEKSGYINKPMTSFAYFAAGSSIGEPVIKSYQEGSLCWYNLLRGYLPTSDVNNPMHYIRGSGLNSGEPTFFPLDGDPVDDPNGTHGDVDGQGANSFPSDRRMAMCTGPFAMAPGDTQEVVIALVGGQSFSNLASISALKNNVKNIRKSYINSIKYKAPQVTSQITFPSNTSARLRVNTKISGATTMTIQLKNYSGIVSYILTLFDDGAHEDGGAGDGIFGNTLTLLQTSQALHADLIVAYNDGNIIKWEEVLKNLTLSGPLKIERLNVISDNLNHDGQINPGENIRYNVSISNESSVSQSNVTVRLVGVSNPKIIPETNNEEILKAGSLPGQAVTLVDNSFYNFNVSPSMDAQQIIQFYFEMKDENNNIWEDTLSVETGSVFSETPREYKMSLTQGDYPFRLGYRVVYPEQILPHDYEVTFNRDENGITYNLEDITTGIVLLKNQEFPDVYGHNSPIFNGFAIVRGSALPDRTTGWEWNSDGDIWLTSVNGGGALFYGGLDVGENFFGSTISANSVPSVIIKLDANLNSKASVFIRRNGIVYDGIGDFPGEAYTLENGMAKRRLNVSFVEGMENGSNHIWDPIGELGNHEYIFIMNSDYDENTAGGYNDDNWAIDADVLWAGWLRVIDGHTMSESPADLILLNGLLGNDDVFNFNPGSVINVEDYNKAKKFELGQNYPNPFNPTTQIPFNLAKKSEVKINIFNALGQLVKAFEMGIMPAGQHIVEWNGLDDSGRRLSSGIYFYRIEAGIFNATKKMVLIR